MYNINNSTQKREPFSQSQLIDLIAFKIVIFFSSLSLSLSFILFDSDYSKMLPFPYPYLFFGLGILWIIFFSIPILKDLRRINVNIFCIFGVVFALVIVGWLTSLYYGLTNLLGLGSKTLTLFMILISLFLGVSAAKNKKKLMLFARLFLFFSIVFSMIAIYDHAINQNWAAIMLLFAVFLSAAAIEWSNKKMAIYLLLIAAISFYIFSSRGVTLAALVAFLMLMIYGCLTLFSIKIAKNAVTILLIGALISSVLFTFFCAFIYHSEYYDILTRLSLEYTGKNFDSGRLERWYPAIMIGMQSPITGWGLDAVLPRVADIDAGALHNLWLEFFFRLGLIGVILVSSILLFIAFKIRNSRIHIVGSAILLGIILQSSVYGIGGFTHWPATFAYWFLLGILLGLSRSDSVSNNRLKL